ncbi:hypothetical protein [Rhizobium sp. Leaf341]|uniref:hypothetical protein n=1 Tax=Rhizobium sp. Leaf341 TaxID=1736344 RepID=UPI0012E39274|nr:hypothetical protein [Rhizobium sp. Leaf341]
MDLSSLHRLRCRSRRQERVPGFGRRLHVGPLRKRKRGGSPAQPKLFLHALRGFNARRVKKDHATRFTVLL